MRQFSFFLVFVLGSNLFLVDWYHLEGVIITTIFISSFLISSFGLLCVSFVNVYQFVCVLLSLFGFEGGMLDLIVFVPGHCLSFTIHLKLTLKYDSRLRAVAYALKKYLLKVLHD